MKRTIAAISSLFLLTSLAGAQEYTRIEMEIEIDKPADEVWAAVGDYCAISEWLGIDCAITSGDGGVGSVRSLAGGRVTEILVAETELSYGYTQPAVEGQFYNHYHGFMEARPIDADSTRMIYTLMYDVSNLPDQAAKDADIARRRGMFENALATMKQIAEGQ